MRNTLALQLEIIPVKGWTNHNLVQSKHRPDTSSSDDPYWAVAVGQHFETNLLGEITLNQILVGAAVEESEAVMSL